jgi:hypothetical protein
MVEGLEDLLHTGGLEHHGTLDQDVAASPVNLLIRGVRKVSARSSRCWIRSNGSLADPSAY